MKLNFSFDEKFEGLLDGLNSKYGQDMFKIEGLSEDHLDLNKLHQNYFNPGDLSDFSVDQNANVRCKDISTFMAESFKPFTKLQTYYLLWEKLNKIYGNDIADNSIEKIINGSLYLHDSHNAAYVPYCFAFTVKDIVEKGLPFHHNIKSGPAKHLNTFIEHIIQSIWYFSNNISGAVGLPDLFIYMQYFIKHDLETGYMTGDNLDRQIEQYFQILTYSINQPTRNSQQSAFTNLTLLDENYLVEYTKDEIYPDGSKAIDYLDDIMLLQKHYVTWLSQERKRQMFTFPVMTASLFYDEEKKEFRDKETYNFMLNHNLQWNDVNWYRSINLGASANCCRLMSDANELEKKMKIASTFTANSLNTEIKTNKPEKLEGMSNSIGGTDRRIGSFKVVTINMPRLALKAKNDKLKYLELLHDECEYSKYILHAIRELIIERINGGFLPLYTHDFMDINRQFATIGINGIYESMYYMGLVEETPEGQLYSKDGENFVEDVLQRINHSIENGFEKYNFTFNIEQIPGEKVSHIFADKDDLLFDDQEFEIYSNQWIPLVVKCDPLDRVRYSAKFDKYVQGGAITHMNMQERFKTVEDYKNFVDTVCELGCYYFAFNYIISICKMNHSFFGDVCDICGGPKTDEYTRIVGYLVPVTSFGRHRKKEFSNRIKYKC